MKKAFSLQNLFLALLILGVLPFLILALFAHPQVDDRWFSNQIHELGFLKSMATWYLDWHGRYVLSVILSFNPMYFEFVEGYKINPVILLLSYIGSLFLLIRTVFGEAVTVKEAAIGSLMVLLCFLVAMPGLADGIYWLAAAVCYQFTAVMILLLLSLLMRIEIADTNGSPSRNLAVGAAVLIIAITGMNETSMFFLFILLVSIATVKFLSRRRVDRMYAIFIALSGVCSLVVMSSPGNSKRIEYYPTRHDLWFSLKSAFLKLGGDLHQWLFLAPTLVVTMLMIPIALRAAERRSPGPERLACHPGYIVTVTLGLAFACFFLIYWNIGDVYWPVRTENFVFLVFLVGWFYFAFAMVVHLRKKHGYAMQRLARYAVPLAVLLTAIPAWNYRNSNLHLALAELTDGSLTTYNTEMYKRYGDVRLCPSDYCEVEPLTFRPKSVTFEDITPYFNDYRNVQFAKSFNKRGVAVKLR